MELPVVSMCFNPRRSKFATKAQVLKQWNPEWCPRYFMSDYSAAELSAVEAVFPNTKTYLCDFHREQAWLRWCRDQKHGLTQTEADNLLTLLRTCAWAPPIPDDQDPAKCYKEAVAQLKSSQIWQNHASVRQWLSSKWLPIPEVIPRCRAGFYTCMYYI